MKTEIINIRVDEKTKLKLLQQSQYYNTSLSRFMLDTAEKACDLDVVQIWIHAYIDWVINNNYHTSVITHYRTEDNYEAWSVPTFEDTYFNKVDLLTAFEYNIDPFLPRMCDVLDQWNEFVRRLKLLGLWEEDNVIR